MRVFQLPCLPIEPLGGSKLPNPFKTLHYSMDGHRVQTIDDVASIADVFITCTGNRNVITRQHMNRMKNGAVVANMGHRCVQGLSILNPYKRSV